MKIFVVSVRLIGERGYRNLRSFKSYNEANKFCKECERVSVLPSEIYEIDEIELEDK